MRLSTLVFLGFFIVIGLSLLDSYINYMLSTKVNKNIAFVTNSESVIRNSTRLHKGIIEMQSAFRGFLLTSDEDFLEPYFDALKTVPPLIKEQKKLVKNSPAQAARLDSIEKLHKLWITYADSLIESKKEAIGQNRASVRYSQLFENKLRKHVGKNLNVRITQLFREFDRYEYRLRESRRELLSSSIRTTKNYSLVFILLTVFVGIVSSIYIIWLISKRISQMVGLAESISKGHFTVLNDSKNDELTSLSRSLNAMSVTLSTNIRDLEKRNKELNKFAYVVSHDLKAPIRGIYNVIQWIEEDHGREISSQMRKYLDIIPDRITRMEGLIDGLLDYARISRDKHLKERVDVDVLLQGVVELLVPKNFKVTIGLMPVLYTEKILLEQVFSNLVSNAVKYTRGSTGEINITCKDLENVYEFTVADNGIGIEPAYNQKIFEIFQTLREKHDKESTGIGLAIVKRIIDEQNGCIKVVSQPGQGASFIFTWLKN